MRNEKLKMIFFGKFHCDVLPVGGGSETYVDSHIKHSALYTSDKFCLAVGRTLKVKSANHSVGGA